MNEPQYAQKQRYNPLKNGRNTSFRAIDLFAGAGGSTLGLQNAGLHHELLVEIDKDAVRTLTNNLPSAPVLQADVASVCFKKYKGAIDLIQAGFPCQAFSSAGKRQGFSDTRGQLFFQFARCVSEVRPKVAVAENVRGLLSHDRGRTLQTILRTFHTLGYRVCFRLLKAQYHDVPQKRERLIIMAVRDDLELPMLFPKERPYTISVRSALKNVPGSPGGYWKDLPIEIQKAYMGASFYSGGGRTGIARRLSWDEPSLTIVCSPSQKQTERCHPAETRPLTVHESARIQTFPDSWIFAGSMASQYKQIGNAFPPNLAFHLGESVVAMLTGEFDETKFIQETPHISAPELWPTDQLPVFPVRVHDRPTSSA